MPAVCEACGKRTTVGNTIARRGRANYLRVVGIKTTGITRRKFKPNLHKVKAQMANGTVRRMTLCAQCIRSGKVTKPVARPKQPAQA